MVIRPSEAKAFWTEISRKLRCPWSRGLKPVVSDARAGAKAARHRQCSAIIVALGVVVDQTGQHSGRLAALQRRFREGHGH